MVAAHISNELLADQAIFCYCGRMSKESRLDDLVREQLTLRRGEWKTIAAEAGVSYSWLSKFVNRKIDNPGYETLRGLHAYLGPAKRKVAA